MTYLLDACALIAWLDEERGEGYEAVDALIEQAYAGNCTLSMGVVNWVEVFYHFIRRAGQEIAGRIIRDTEELPIEVIDTVSPPVRRAAAILKAHYPMSLADCFLCAVAQSLSATIVTKDGELRAAEQGEMLPVLWIT